MRERARRSERGQVLPLVALLMVAMGGSAVLLVRLGGVAADRAQASAAADAAALAGAAEGRPAAERLAAANGAQVRSYREEGSDTEVWVSVGRAGATARATRTGIEGATAGEAPALRAALARAGQLLGGPIAVRRIVAGGLAADVSSSVSERLASVAAQAGLCRPEPDARPDRFVLCPPPPATESPIGER
jgi:hypothetical protein